MKRRTFVKNSSIALTASILPIPSFHMNEKKKYKIGLQAFTIRDAMAKDLLGSLKIVKSLGYQDLELYGFDADKVAYYGYAAADFKKVLGDLGLSSSSCHYGFSEYIMASNEALGKFVDKCIAGAHALSHSYITWPWMAPEQRNLNTFERFVMWHIKDMDKLTRDYSELGNGSIDYSKMIPSLDTSGLEFYYLEQGGNFANHSIQSITDSAEFFKQNLKQYL